MCGIAGLISHKPVAAELYESLVQLQHRGQDAAGIMTCDERFHSKIGKGLARDVFQPEDIRALTGNLGIAHARYPTAGGFSIEEAQPFWLGSPYGIALAHNGNLTNCNQLKQKLHSQRRHLNTRSDSEMLIHLFAEGFAKHLPTDSDSEFFEHICDALKHVFEAAKGSYSVVSSIIGKGLIAFRDPHGIRPLVMGRRERSEGTDILIASENTPFSSLNFTLSGDILPGEVVYISLSGQEFRRQLQVAEFRPCIFEYVYFARPDSRLNQIGVYRSRLRMGENLAKRWREIYPELKPDVVVPVPFTSNTAALAFAQTLDLPYSEGLYKNPFIGRTFIMPDTALRQRSVRHKLSPQPSELKDKNVLLLDDSIVRGTTSREIVRMVKEAGAKAVYFVSACPPVRFPCHYGINIPTYEELIANQKTLAEIQTYLGVDALLYQTQPDLAEAVIRTSEQKINKFCMACMDGQYIPGTLTNNDLTGSAHEK